MTKSNSSSIDRLTVTVRVWVTVGTGPQCCNGETFGPPIKACILYSERLASQTIRESVDLLDHRHSCSGSVSIL